MIGGTRFRMNTDIARQSALSARIARGQSDIATANRLQMPSDDPTASARAAQVERARTDTAAWSTIVGGASALAVRADAALGSAQDVVDRARELMTTLVSGSASDADRISAGDALHGMADDLDALSMTTDAGGARVFPDHAPLAVPVGPNATVAPTLSLADAFANGGASIATTLRDAAAALAQPAPGPRDAALAGIVAAVGHLADARAIIGGWEARLDAIATRLSEGDVASQEELAALTQTDVPATVARIQADQLTLDASRSLFARVNKSTLFDLLG